jgi:vacuolar protein sorting-associated protein 13D
MSTLSDSLDLATMDSRHQQLRRRIKRDNRDHLRTGLRGLGVGILGGMTSILTQTYEGVANDGLQGLVSGLGRGILGTITKPAVGMLDFASEAASAVRDTSRKISSSHAPPVRRVRYPRQCLGSGRLIQPYEERQAEGQQFFYRSSIVDREEDEEFNSFEIILPDTACLITSERVRFLTWGHYSSNHGKILLSISFENLIRCSAELNELPNSLMGAYIVLVVNDVNAATSYATYGDFNSLKCIKTPKVRCSSDRTAMRACEQINAAKSSFEEKKLYRIL